MSESRRAILDALRSAADARPAPQPEGHHPGRPHTPADLAVDIVDSIVGAAASAACRSHAVASMSRIGPAGYRRSIECLVTWDGRDGLRGVTAPTLCVAGSDDTNAPVRAVQRLAETIPGARFELIPGAGHLVNLEAPAAFNACLEGFVA